MTPADVDPDIGRFVATVAQDLSAYPDLETLPVHEARAILETVRARWMEGGPVMHETLALAAPVRGGQVAVRVHRPAAERNLPVLVYLHGGGWTFFSVYTHDRLMREYAAGAHAVVVGVDYALSPEARFPTALDQVTDVLRWLPEAAGQLGIDAARLAVGGDSAGANLALCACLALRDAGEHERVRALLLNYGAFDARDPDAAGSPFGGPGYMLGAEEMQGYWANYVRSDADRDDPLVSPLRADLAALPATLLVIPECDVLAPQSFRMAERLRYAGVPTRTMRYPGATHSFLEAASIAALSRRALADSSAWLREQLADAATPNFASRA